MFEMFFIVSSEYQNMIQIPQNKGKTFKHIVY